MLDVCFAVGDGGQTSFPTDATNVSSASKTWRPSAGPSSCTASTTTRGTRTSKASSGTSSRPRPTARRAPWSIIPVGLLRALCASGSQTPAGCPRGATWTPCFLVLYVEIPDSDAVIGVVKSCFDDCDYCDYYDSRFVSPSAEGKEGEEGESPERAPRGAGRRLAGRLQPGRPVPGGQLQEAPEAPLQQVGFPGLVVGSSPCP